MSRAGTPSESPRDDHIDILTQRVVRQEAVLESLATTVNKLADAVSSIGKKLDIVATSGRWTRQDIFAGGMFVIAVVGIASALIVSHNSGQMAVLEARRDGDARVNEIRREGDAQIRTLLVAQNSAVVEENSRDIKVLRDRMTTAEGWFRTSAARSDFNQVLIAMLWEKCMGAPLPAPILPNSAPFAGGTYP